MNNRITTDQIAELLAQGKPADYPVTIDFGKKIEDMISEGQYDWQPSDINSRNFPVQGEGTVEVNLELVHFDRVIGSDDAKAELDRLGLRPATIEELLAFGSTYPDVQREFPVIALGSSWLDRNGNRRVPYLFSGGAERKLNLDWRGDPWSGICRFLAVRK